MLRQVRLLLVFAGTTLILAAAIAWQQDSRDDGKTLSPISAIPQRSQWYKGNLHTHSFWSDGDDFPEMIADWYKRSSYQFLALSDHNVLSEGERWLPITEKSVRPLALEKYLQRFGKSWVEMREKEGRQEVRLKPLDEFRSLLEEPGKFLLIQAEEITHAYAKRPVHLNAVNLRDVIKPIDGGSVSETISVNHRQVAEQVKRTRRKMLTFLNHPNFGWGITAEDMIAAPELRFFEVYNGHPSVRNEGDEHHPSCDQLWDIMLTMRLAKFGLGPVYGLATDDAHGYHSYGVGKVNPGRGWLMVQAPYLSAESIVRAIENLDFYASTGVILEKIDVSPEQISLTIRSEPGVRYRTEFIGTLKSASLESTARATKENKLGNVTRIYGKDVGQVLAESTDTSPKYQLSGNEWYVRARVTSSKLHPNPYRKGDLEMAWTQPAIPARQE